MAEPGGTSCAARKHLMRQAINVNCLNVQKLEHRAYVARTPTRKGGGEQEGSLVPGIAAREGQLGTVSAS